MPKRIVGNDLARLISYVTKTEKCWGWNGSRTGDGRPMIWFRGRVVTASRVSYTLHRGEIPRGLFVCHHCDNPQCVNPDHLFLGTNQDNMDDAKRKNGINRGEKHGMAVLTAQQVDEIRRVGKKGESNAALARKFGVSFSTVRRIKNGRSWKHLNRAGDKK